MTHSFFATMGGFALDHSQCAKWSASLTAKAVLHIAETDGTILDISKDTIADKSKANGVSKALVCLQTGYLVLQLSGRLAEHLPITLLEVNAFGHVLCTLTLYVFWFKKPLDVNEPIPVQPEWAQRLSEMWSMDDRLFDYSSTRDLRAGQVKEHEVFDHVRYKIVLKKVRSPTATLPAIVSSTVEDHENDYMERTSDDLQSTPHLRQMSKYGDESCQLEDLLFVL